MNMTENNINRKIAESIRKLRASHGLTADQMAEIIGIQPGSYTNKESGLRGFNINEVRDISHHFRITIQELITGRKPRQTTREDLGLSEEAFRNLEQFHRNNPPEATEFLSACLSSIEFLHLLSEYLILPDENESDAQKTILCRCGPHTIRMTPASYKEAIGRSLIRKLSEIKEEQYG